MARKVPKTRKCKDCGKTKNIGEFKSAGKDYTKSCRLCINEKMSNNKKTIKHNEFYIYRFLGRNNEIYYVGKTVNIAKRMSQHKRDSVVDFEEVYYIEYAAVESDYKMNIYEIHYICKYKPKYNIEFASDNIKLFDFTEVEWKPYVLKEYYDLLNRDSLMNCGHGINKKEIIHNLENDEVFYDDFLKEYNDSKFTNYYMNSYHYGEMDYLNMQYEEDEEINYKRGGHNSTK